MADNFYKFFGKLILLFGEVPTETIVYNKIRLEVRDERQHRALMGCLAVVAKCSLDEEPCP